ncbi:junctional adhesion molecule A-like [Ixodes scapularis]|uniref:junctional adhesion molecule A-like n=1 Tax=Ixodes scapularis TaxID=6945 RepID=UPI001A9D3C22|nr:junctional adhesion molecule A-like [Ixodes scapularis]
MEAIILTVLAASSFSLVAASDAPKLQELVFPKTTALGESVSVSCAASKGTRPMTFAWLKDGVPVVSSARVITSSVADNVALLVINKLAALDVGNYSCVARNARGEDRVTATLTVKGNR